MTNEGNIKRENHPSQCNLILAWMKEGKSITPIDALNEFGCFRLGARIADLKDRGYSIRTTILHRNGKRFASYSLNEEEIR